MATITSNEYKYRLAIKKIDFENDSFKIILMATGFVFDAAAHSLYSDVSSYELAEGNGYIRNDKILTGVVVTKNDTDKRADITWDNPAWTAVGGAIGPTPGAIIFDDSEADDVIIGYIDFVTEQTQVSGGIFTVGNPEVRIR